MTSITIAALLSLSANAQEVRALHLSPDAPAVDIFVGGAVTPTIADLAFTEGTGYLAVPAGTYDFKISPAGTTPQDAVLDFDLTLDADTKYSAIAFDSVANIAPLALVDDDVAIAPSDIRLQVAHTAVGVGDVGVLVGGLGVVTTGFGFGDSFVADLPAKAYTIGLDLDADDRADFTFDVPNLGGGILVDVFAVTDSAGSPFLLAWLPDGSTARVDGAAVEPAGLRVTHLSPDAPDVDVYVDGALTVPGLGFGELAGYVDVPAGTHRVEVVVAGTAGPAVIDTDIEVKAGKDYTVAAYDDVASIDAAVLRNPGCDRVNTGTYCVQAFHAADGVGDVDLWDLTRGRQLASGFGFGTGAGLLVPAGAWTLGLDADRNGTADFEFSVPDIGDRVLANVFAVTDATGPFLRVLLPDGTNVRIDPN